MCIKIYTQHTFKPHFSDEEVDKILVLYLDYNGPLHIFDFQENTYIKYEKISTLPNSFLGNTSGKKFASYIPGTMVYFIFMTNLNLSTCLYYSLCYGIPHRRCHWQALDCTKKKCWFLFHKIQEVINQSFSTS